MSLAEIEKTCFWLFQESLSGSLSSEVSLGLGWCDSVFEPVTGHNGSRVSHQSSIRSCATPDHTPAQQGVRPPHLCPSRGMIPVVTIVALEAHADSPGVQSPCHGHQLRFLHELTSIHPATTINRPPMVPPHCKELPAGEEVIARQRPSPVIQRDGG
jgi:hypothetical protein